MIDKNSGKYAVPSDEDNEPDSDESVLKNYSGIKSKSEIEMLEEQELGRTLLELEGLFSKDYQFTSEDLCAIHEEWLGDIYPMAGKYRSVNMSKGGFHFAATTQIERLMTEFEKKFLKKYTPCNFNDLEQVIHALAVVHVEFILIHPFREGNGRLARLLASLMANQAGLPPLNFLPIDQNVNEDGYQRYIDAIHHGVSCDYSPMTDVFREIISVSQKTV